MADDQKEQTIVTEYDAPGEGEQEPTDAYMGELVEGE